MREGPSGLFWPLFAFGLLTAGCSAEERLTFDSVGKAEARAAADYDRCRCPGGSICIVCSGATFDRYWVTLEEPEGDERCLDGEESFSATWASETGDALEASTDFRCRSLEVAVETSAGESAPVGSLTISDGSREFHIDQPFSSPTLELMADVPAAPDRLEIAVGQELSIAATGADELVEISARFESDIVASQREAVDADADAVGASLMVTVPELDSGAYSLLVYAKPLLPADACSGPVRCLGLSGSLEVEVFVP